MSPGLCNPGPDLDKLGYRHIVKEVSISSKELAGSHRGGGREDGPWEQELRGRAGSLGAEREV